MEREFIGTCVHTHCDMDHLEVVTKNACRKYKVPKLELKKVRWKDSTMAQLDKELGLIELNERYHGDNLCVLLHELAHWLTFQLYGNVEDHGPEFVSYYAELLDAYKIIPFDAFLVLLNRYGIEMA